MNRPFAAELERRAPADYWLAMKLLSSWVPLSSVRPEHLGSVEAMTLQRLADLRNTEGITLSADVADWLRKYGMIE